MKNSLFEFKKCLTPQFIYPFGLFVIFFILYILSFNFRIGDQFFYAKDIETGRAITWAEPGHLIHRPLGWLLYKFSQTFGYTGRAVTILQFESAFFGAIGVSAFFYLGYNVVKDIRIALFSASMLAFSHSYWAYSGNGCAYVPSTCIVIFAFILLFKLPEFLKHQQRTLYVLAISLISALSALFWVPQVLSLPAIVLGIIIIPQHLNYRKRFTLAFIYLLGIILFLIVPLLVGAIFINGCKSFGDLLVTIDSPRQGIPLQLSRNFLRIFYGVAKAFVAIPDFGATVRGLLTGDFYLVETNFFLEAGKFFAVWAILLLTVSSFVVKGKMIERNFKIAILILGVCVLPFFFLGMLLLGSDLERVLPALPAAILVIAIAYTTFWRPMELKLIKVVSIAVVVALPIWNFTGFFMPARNVVNDKDWKMAKSFEQKMDPNDIVITWGLDIHSIGTFLFYYANRCCISLNMDIVLNGSMGWDERLAKKIKNSLDNGGKVIIHDRLIIEKDVPESRWSEKEFPHPNRQELRTFFSQYRKTLAWIIEDELFWEITM